jgi:purine-nucleoside phosphorylase
MIVNGLVETLKKYGILHQIGKTWTTDAPYRETTGKIEARKKEGCLIVDMEAAGMMAAA